MTTTATLGSTAVPHVPPYHTHTYNMTLFDVMRTLLRIAQFESKRFFGDERHLQSYEQRIISYLITLSSPQQLDHRHNS